MNWIKSEEKTTVFNCICVECIAEIKNNTTGEVREHKTIELLEEGHVHPNTFNWSENNYSCDCNRLLFFERANNEEETGDDLIECTDGKFSVNLKNCKDGKVYYREFN